MEDYLSQAKQARRKVLELIYRAGTSHIASNFSVIDIATVLYANLKPQDRVVWSAGWKAATIYYFLWRQGKITKEQLDSFPNEPFIALAETSVPGVEVAGGSMGHGLPVAVGMAMGLKKQHEETVSMLGGDEFQPALPMVYCIMSDGEMNEGTTWEAAALAAHHKLNNLIVFIDVNKWQAMGKTKDVLNMEPLEDKWSAFSFGTRRVNGHAYDELEGALRFAGLFMPLAIICDTIKGKGVSFMENHLLFHYKNVDDEDYKKALLELA